jgi:hypothetical protein
MFGWIRLGSRRNEINAAADKEMAAMRLVMTTALLAAALFGLASAGNSLMAAEHDGNWSVVVITEKGDCDHAYRYSVSVKDGHLKYTGDAAVTMAGTVAANGAVKVSIRLGEKGANGAGRLSNNSGTGTWHGAATNSTCAGRWEAERR